MTGITLTSRDVTALRDIVLFPDDEEAGPGLPWRLLEEVRSLIGCDVVELDRTCPTERKLGLEQAVGDAREVVKHEQADPYYWQLYWASTPCSWVDRPGNARDVTKISDFWSDREWTGSAMFGEYGQRWRSFREIGMRLPDLPQFSMKLLCWRGPGRDFGERERLLLQLLRPHIAETWRHAERRRQTPLRLTCRQLELLEYVAQGLTNVQVARRMSLSEGTVRTHLNNIYERLGVGSRTAAARRLRDLTADTSIGS
jgi:DNA-binding CsgD family transcriptional regulator